MYSPNVYNYAPASFINTWQVNETRNTKHHLRNNEHFFLSPTLKVNFSKGSFLLPYQNCGLIWAIPGCNATSQYSYPSNANNRWKQIIIHVAHISYQSWVWESSQLPWSPFFTYPNLLSEKNKIRMHLSHSCLKLGTTWALDVNRRLLPSILVAHPQPTHPISSYNMEQWITIFYMYKYTTIPYHIQYHAYLVSNPQLTSQSQYNLSYMCSRLGCPRNKQFFVLVRTETNRNSICFVSVSVFFAKLKK
jgi:hypothetical protein